MGVISTTQSFSNGEQVTATKLNTITSGSTFDSSAVDDSTTQVSGGAIIVRDGGITPAKMASGSGTAASPAYRFSTDTDTGFYRPASNQIGASVGGTGQVIIKDGVVEPVTDDDVDLGSSSKQFKDGYFDGTVNADGLVVGGGTALTEVKSYSGSVDIGNISPGDSSEYTISASGVAAGSAVVAIPPAALTSANTDFLWCAYTAADNIYLRVSLNDGLNTPLPSWQPGSQPMTWNFLVFET